MQSKIIRDDLYQVPIEKLGLSIKAINACKRLGMDSVGDCVDVIDRLRGGVFPRRLFPVFDEIVVIVVEYIHDYCVERGGQ